MKGYLYGPLIPSVGIIIFYKCSLLRDLRQIRVSRLIQVGTRYSFRGLEVESLQEFLVSYPFTVFYRMQLWDGACFT